MKRRMKSVLCILFMAAACAGCGHKDNGSEPADTEAFAEKSVHEADMENIDGAEEQGSPKPTEKLKVPRTKKELEEALGTVDEQGKWTPPKGSYIDPATGNILNKDGVVVGTTQEPYSVARPGSKG